MGTQISELTPLHQTTLLKSDQHKESSFLTGLGRGNYSLSPLGTGMVMAMGFPSCFFISHVFWLLPVVFELLCRSLLREQYQNSLFPVNEELEWAVGAWVIWKWWVGCSCHVGEDGPATVFLFFSKIGRRMGSASGRHATRAGFGSGGSGFGQIRCPSVENKLTDYPFANRPLIGSGGRVDWAGLAGGWSGNGLASGLFWIFLGLQVNFKNSAHIIVLDFFELFWAIL